MRKKASRAVNLSWLKVVLLFWIFFSGCSEKNPEVLRIGVLVPLSGEARYWGRVNLACARVTQQMVNEAGGVMIDGVCYSVELVVRDTRMQPDWTATQLEEMLMNENVRYIIGPNVDETILAVLPIIEALNAVHISYGFDKAFYSPPHKNSLLGMPPDYLSIPLMLKYLINHREIKSVAFLYPGTLNARIQRESITVMAQMMGIEVLSALQYTIDEEEYDMELFDEAPFKKAIEMNPDAIILVGLLPATAPEVIMRLNQLGYKGYKMSSSALEPAYFKSQMQWMDGACFLGSGISVLPQSEYFKRFKAKYIEMNGHWDEEAGAKGYALEILLKVLQKAGADALTDTSIFLDSLGSFDIQDPFVKADRRLKFIGEKLFSQKRLLNIMPSLCMIENAQFNFIALEDTL